MVYGIVRQSGGDILVQSELGRGSTFTVFLPRVEADTSAVEKRETEMQRGSGELILVVEDEPVLRRLSLLMLERLGYRAFEAADGDEAVRVTEEEGLRPDLVLTDVVIPGMSGRALADRLRTAVPGVKVVFMSGYTDDKIADRGVLDAGVNFLQKPFSTRDLAAAIKLALG